MAGDELLRSRKSRCAALYAAEQQPCAEPTGSAVRATASPPAATPKLQQAQVKRAEQAKETRQPGQRI